MKTLRSKIITFVFTLLILPAIPLSYFVMQLLDKSYRIGVNDRVETALDAGMQISIQYYQNQKKRMQNLMVQFRDADELNKNLIKSVLESEFEGATFNLLPLQEWRYLETYIPKTTIEKFLASSNSDLIWPSTDRMTLFALAQIDNQILEILYPFSPIFQESAQQIQEVNQIFKTLGLVNKQIYKSFLYTFLLIYMSGLLIALVASFIISKKITQPIEILTKAMEQVGKGNLDHRIELAGNDEFKKLADSFNQMNKELYINQRKIIELEKMATWQQMARRLAHEIKNPLTPIQLMAQQLVDKYDGPDKTYRSILKESYDIIEQEVESLKKLVRAFSDFARLPDFEPAKNDICQLLLSLKKLYSNIDIRLTLAAESIELIFDYDYLKRVFINLIDNAIAASDDTEPIYISLQNTPDTIIITLKDNGHGIEEENMQKVFEPYFSTKKAGVGLGLSIAKKIIEEHAGTIEIDSKINIGTTINIKLVKNLTIPKLENHV
jgi:nitrogen fixation/metabolism regulation signal transduction histidine kinase